MTIVVTLFSGIVLGSLYSVMAMGLTISWGTLKIFNFAHGSIVVLGAYVAWFAMMTRSAIFTRQWGLGLNYPAAFLLVIGVSSLVGVVIEKLAMRPLLPRRNFMIAIIISTLGTAMFLQNGILIAFGPRYKMLPPIREGFVTFGSITMSYQKLIIAVLSLSILILMHFFLKRTKIGMAMRAVEQDREAARLVGIPIERIFTFTIAISAVLAGLSGVMVGNLYYITPALAMADPLLKSFIVIVLGGLGSIKGTIYSSYMVGIVESFTALFLGIFWCLPVLFLFMMGFLILKPKGLFG